MTWRAWFAMWRRPEDFVSYGWMRDHDRRALSVGWIHPMLPRWKSPKEIAQERRAAMRSRFRKSA